MQFRLRQLLAHPALSALSRLARLSVNVLTMTAIFTDTPDLSAEDQRRAWRELTLAIEAMNRHQAQAEATQVAADAQPTRLAARWRTFLGTFARRWVPLRSHRSAEQAVSMPVKDLL
jgi:hypothetical protein